MSPKYKISSLLMEAGVSYNNKQRLHKAGYFRELLATNPDIDEHGVSEQERHAETDVPNWTDGSPGIEF